MTLVPTPTYTATEAAFAANLNPLSGLPSADPAIATYRPDAFVVRSEPGQGLPAGAQTTELVVEVLHPTTPGFTLVTQERPGRRPALGPLGSLTPRDVVVARTLGAAITAADAPADLADLVQAAGLPLTTLSGVDATPARMGHGRAPRWSFSETPDRGAGAFLEFRADAPGGATVAWRYDPLLTTWRRWVDGAAVMDPATGEPLTVANVVIMDVPGQPGQDGWWTGGGAAALLRDGTRLSGRWVRTDETTPLGLVDGRGMSLALKPGNTWWVVVTHPATTAVTPPASP